MKNRLLLQLAAVIVMLAAWSTPSSAQENPADTIPDWKISFNTGINLNQSTFSENWKGGGVNSFGFNSLLNFKANYKHDRRSFDNQIDLLYGMVNNEGQGYRKTVDRIFLDTKLGYALTEKWNAYLAASLLSQFAPGYKYEKDANNVEHTKLVSDSFAPTFITLSLGAEYKPTDYFTVRISPLAPRLTLLRNNDGRYAAADSLRPYGVPVGESSRFEWGSLLQAEFAKDIAPNINLKWRYVLFANYQTLEANKVDHRIDVNITAKVTKYINVSLGGIYLYDFDQDISPQISQAFSLGVAYAVQNYKEEKPK